MNDKYVITITRQFGSLGRPIAKKLGELLGIECYDRDIVECTAKNMGKTVSFISDQEEISKKLFFNMRYPLGMGTSEIQKKIFYVQEAIIKQIADSESCIIVGRCSDYVLKDLKNVIHIYIYAPYKDRLNNCIDTLKMNKEDAKKSIVEVDKARESYHKIFTGYYPNDENHKDLMINSTLLGIDGTAKMIADIVACKFD